MFTISEYADRAMVAGYRDLRASGVIASRGSLSAQPLSYDRNQELLLFIEIAVFGMADRTAGFNRDMIPHIVGIAFAAAQTEQHPLSSERYAAWREYEIELTRRALNANR